MPTLRKLIRKGWLSMTFVPVLGGSAFKNKGVQPLLNAVVDYLPSPLDVVDYHGLQAGRRNGNPRYPARADDQDALRRPCLQDHERPLRGSLTFTRIYSGQSQEGRCDPQFDQGVATSASAG